MVFSTISHFLIFQQAVSNRILTNKGEFMQHIDIYRTATLLIQHHQFMAGDEASQRMGDLMFHGDYEGALAWLYVRKAVDDMIQNGAKTLH